MIIFGCASPLELLHPCLDTCSSFPLPSDGDDTGVSKEQRRKTMEEIGALSASKKHFAGSRRIGKRLMAHHHLGDLLTCPGGTVSMLAVTFSFCISMSDDPATCLATCVCCVPL
mmetsp:Transcript_3276/g.4381  ORF Transcript_3276/g.4381 Transcript_3276/m.4381 type:complete len:114 (-) Transcript_3276:60-401(-)